MSTIIYNYDPQNPHANTKEIITTEYLPIEPLFPIKVIEIPWVEHDIPLTPEEKKERNKGKEKIPSILFGVTREYNKKRIFNPTEEEINKAVRKSSKVIVLIGCSKGFIPDYEKIGVIYIQDTPIEIQNNFYITGSVLLPDDKHVAWAYKEREYDGHGRYDVGDICYVIGLKNNGPSFLPFVQTGKLLTIYRYS